MRSTILEIATETLAFLERECFERELSGDVIDKVLEVLLATNQSNGFIDFASKE